MASLAKLLISIGADTAGFETDMKRLVRNNKKNIDQLKSDAAQMGKAFGLALAATATAMTAIVKKTVDVADHMRDLSQQTGISTEVLSGYAYAAEQSGSSLEALTGGIRKMQRSIVDASSGMAEQQRAFERLGLSANELLKLSPDKAFELIADKLSKMENATVKAATAQEIFGRSGASLLPIMNEGAAGIQAMTSRVEELNATISKEFSDNADRFNDNLGDMKLVAQGAAITFTEALLPGLVGFQEYIIKAAVGTNDFSKAGEFVINVVKRMAQAFAALKGILEAVGTVLVGIVAAFIGGMRAIVGSLLAMNTALANSLAALGKGDFAASAAALADVPNKMADAWNAGAKEMATALAFIPDRLAEIKDETDATIADIEKAFTGAAGPVSDLGDVALETADDFGSLNKALDDARKKYADTKAIAGWKKRLEDVNKTVADAVTLLDELVAAQEEYERSLQSILDTYYPIQAEGRRVGETFAVLERALRKGDITAAQFEETVRRVTDGFNEMATGADAASGGVDLFAVAMDEAARILERTFADIFEGMVDGSLDAWAAIEDGFLSLVKTIAQNPIRVIVADIQKAFGPGGGGFGSLDLTKLGQGLVESLGAIFGLGSADSLFGQVGSSLGQIFGEKLFGMLGGQFFPGLLGALGSWAGPIGTALGSILGSALGDLIGGLFERDLAFTLGGTGAGTGAQRLKSPLADVVGISGQGGFGDLNDPSTLGGQLGKAIVEFDTQMAKILKEVTTSTQFDAIRKSLETWVGSWGEGADAADVLASRFSVILSNFDADFQSFVRGAADFEEQIERFGVALSVDKLFRENADIFSGRTTGELLDLVAAFRDGADSMSDAFNEFLTILNRVVGVRKSLQDYAASDLLADFSALNIDLSLADALARVNTELTNAIANFDGSVESFEQIGVLALAAREGELKLLAEIDAIQKGINSNLDKLKNDILGITSGDATGAELFNQAQDLIGKITVNSTAADIAGIERQFDSLIRSIAPEDQAFMQAEIVGLIELFRARANDILNLRSQETIDSAANMRTLVDDFIVRIGDPLDIIAGALEGENLPEVMAEGLSDINTSVASIGPQVAAAIAQGLNSVTIQVTVADGGLVTQ